MVQRPHHCLHGANLPVHLALRFTVTYEQDPEILKLVYLGQQLTLKLQGAIYHFRRTRRGSSSLKVLTLTPDALRPDRKTPPGILKVQDCKEQKRQSTNLPFVHEDELTNQIYDKGDWHQLKMNFVQRIKVFTPFL